MSLYSDAVLATSGLQSYWRLGEPSGTSAIDAKGSVTGTYVNTPSLAQAGAIARDSDTGVFFSAASSEYVDFGNVFAFPGYAAFSVEFWIKVASYAGSVAYLVTHQSGGGGWRVSFSTAGKVEFARSDAVGEGTDVGTSPLSIGAWHHVVMTFDGTDMRAYLDGTLEDTDASPKSVVNTGVSLVVAAYSSAILFFNGYLDEVAIYNTALSADTVFDHYAIAAPTTAYRDAVLATSGLQSYWRFGESSGTNAADEIGGKPATYNSVTLNQSGAIPGDTNTGFLCTGASGSAASVNDESAYEFTGTSSFSAEIWYKFTSTYSGGYFVAQSWSGVGGWFLAFDIGAFKVHFGRHDASTDDNAYGLASVALNVWHHLVGTYDGTTVRLYEDGVLIDSKTSSLILPSTTNAAIRVRFGEHGASSGTFSTPIVLDEAAIYNTALSAATILAHFRLGGSGSTPATTIRNYVAVPITPATGDVPYRSASTGWQRLARPSVSSTMTHDGTAGPPAWTANNALAGRSKAAAVTLDGTARDISCPDFIPMTVVLVGTLAGESINGVASALNAYYNYGGAGAHGGGSGSLAGSNDGTVWGVTFASNKITIGARTGGTNSGSGVVVISG